MQEQDYKAINKNGMNLFEVLTVYEQNIPKWVADKYNQFDNNEYYSRIRSF